MAADPSIVLTENNSNTSYSASFTYENFEDLKNELANDSVVIQESDTVFGTSEDSINKVFAFLDDQKTVIIARYRLEQSKLETANSKIALFVLERQQAIDTMQESLPNLEPDARLLQQSFIDLLNEDIIKANDEAFINAELIFNLDARIEKVNDTVEQMKDDTLTIVDWDEEHISSITHYDCDTVEVWYS